MRKFSIETPIGLFVLILVSMFSFKVYDIYKEINLFKKKNFNTYYAEFNNLEGIKISSFVKVGGVSVGQVEKIELKPNLKIIVKLIVDDSVKLKRDATLSVASSGIFGSKFLSISNGMEDEYMKNNDKFMYTNSSLNIENLINKFASK